jgi:hypothetical protein
MTEVRRAQPADADALGRLLHDVHTEFDEFTPARKPSPSARAT